MRTGQDVSLHPPWVLQQGDAHGCPSPAALPAPFGEALSFTVPWYLYPVLFSPHNVSYVVWPEKLLFCQHLLWAQLSYLGALSLRMGMGTALL